MYKLLATIKKETTILLRDQFGLAILFLMPIVLIIVMTFVQDAAFSSINEKGVKIVLVDNDQDSLGVAIKRGLKSTDLVELSDSIGGELATQESALSAIKNGEFLLGVVIPKNATNNIRHSVDGLIQSTLGNEVSNQSLPDSVEIKIIIDPIAKNTIIEGVLSNLREFISGIKTKVMFETFSEQIAEVIPDQENKPQNTYEKSQIITYKKQFASSFEHHKVPTAVQHNVPAWTIFAMFFIVVSLVANIMNEKKEGSVFRLKTVPSSYLTLIMGKVIVFVVICTLQFFSMMLIGIYVLPLIGLDALDLGGNMLGVTLLAISTSFAATGFGVLVGTFAKSQQQGAILGSLLVLLLSAFGGIWVPTYVMPGSMRMISELSPMNWSLAGFYDLFLKGTDTVDILWNCLKLMLFFILTTGIAIRMNVLKR